MTMLSSNGKVLKVSVGGGSNLEAGYGIDITNDKINVDTDIIATKESVEGKQDALEAGDNITIESNTISAPAFDLAVDNETVFAEVYGNSVVLSARTCETRTVLYENPESTYPNNTIQYIKSFILSNAISNYDEVEFVFRGNGDPDRRSENSVSRFDVSHFNASKDAFILSDFHYNSYVDSLWVNKCILTPNSAGTILSVSKSGYQQINTSSYSPWNENQPSFLIHKIVGIKRG